MPTRYQWINYARIHAIRPDHSNLSSNFFGHSYKTQMFPYVACFCDRTLTDDIIEIPAHLALPVKGACLDWEDISRKRTEDLAQILENNPDKRCTMMWSGGIDSTFILTSIIKYLDPRLWDRFIIGLSAGSLWENPYFYRDQILPRFSDIRDIENLQIPANSINISGTLCDKIVCPEIILQWLYRHRGPQRLDQKTDDLIVYLSRFNESPDKSKRIYEQTLESSSRWGVELDTVSDFLWWMVFNFVYVGMYYHDWSRFWTDHKTVSDINHDKFYWFADSRYQQWAMNQSARWPESDSNWHLEYKRRLRESIYELDGNLYYRNFKQKVLGHTPLNNTWQKMQPRLDWVLAVGTDGEKHYTTDHNLSRDLLRLGISS